MASPKQKSSGKVRDPFDWYVEPAWCVESLFRAHPLPGPIYDPACGGGNIIEVAQRFGKEAFGSDIVMRDLSCEIQHDFLSGPPPLPWEFGSIVTNPPYQLAERFARQALKSTDQVAILVRLDFLASQGRYYFFVRDTNPARVLILSRRPSMPPGGEEIEAKGGQHDYCWIVWDATYSGFATEIGWLPP